MTINPITATSVANSDPAGTVPQAAPRRVSGADIVVRAVSPVPAVPKPKPVSAQTCTGCWPPTAETLAAIKADIGDAGPDAKKDVRSHILIASCIARGIDAGTHIRSVGLELGFDGRHIGLLLHADGTPWQKGPDGRYRLI